MKQIALLGTATVTLLLTSSAPLQAQGQAPPAPWTLYGSELIATGPDVSVKFFGWDAAKTDDLFFICGVAKSCHQFLFKNQRPGALDSEGRSNRTFALGEEALFKIVLHSTGETQPSYSGFEDAHGSAPDHDRHDRHDHNDPRFEGDNGQPVTATPEPATMTLFATGLFGLGGLVYRRRRSLEK